ncbi:MAG: hypothetical protein BGN96_07920 [Bacteroidales bacterium 45-6]|nr:MAG: hypothetical protein BGN96_07920 [Bacteroidales bacterium 45-6]
MGQEQARDDAAKMVLENINTGFSAAGTVAGAGELFTRANAGARIMYTTFNGTRSWVATSKVLSTFKAIGDYTVVGGIVVDATLGFTGYETPGKATANISVNVAAWGIGGIPGLAIGVGYTVLDQLRAFDGSAGMSPYRSPIEVVPDAIHVPKPLVGY